VTRARVLGGLTVAGALVASLVYAPMLIPQETTAGQGSNAGAALGAQVDANSAAITALQSQVAELEARPWPSPTTSALPTSSGPVPDATPTATPSVPPPPTSAPPTPTASPTASSGTPVLGSGVSMDGLANTQIGASGNSQGAYSFVPSHSGTLATARFFDQMGSGYGSGDGGQVTPSIRLDDGGRPGVAIWTGPTITMGSSTQIGKLVAVGGSVNAGERYWLVLSHVSGGSFSMNCIYVRQPTGELSPQFTAPWTMAYYSGGSWHTRSGYTPILDVGFADGFHEGNGYMELLYGGNTVTISGSRTATQTFTVPATQTFSEIGVRALVTSGGSPLVATIQTGDGTALASASLTGFAAGDSGNYDTNGRGGYGSAPISLTLAPGSYRLVLSSAGSYTTFAIRKGTAWGYDAATLSSGQYVSGYDLQWYMR
jgi:hypothetical protein